ncbi:hypothetical protein [Bacillus pseudomycoides]|uniref:hypothetical protein n=1 Tax=Bacillus pseudomycoides TaxID=64104 RepID=UPI000BFDE85D|nr:hypothetical protein [Bacillus pseudomycoides]MBD5799397.1 hypothetical protein [Bacillus pseudomycoides]PHG24659.1 hypothetical protein COI47_07665 [Bacillus pseudomycoides]
MNAKRLKSYAKIQEKKAELFERKFLDYRNKMLKLYYLVDDEALRKDIKSFLQDEQGDIAFGSIEECFE